MHRATWILIGVMGVVTLGAVFAARSGWALPQPESEPPSIREGSVRPGTATGGHYGTRYFIGGGIHHGK